MPKVTTKPHEPDLAERASDYCRHGERAAHYLFGIADALESLGGDASKKMIHHLREHAHELHFGTLWVEHGYKEPTQ